MYFVDFCKIILIFDLFFSPMSFKGFKISVESHVIGCDGKFSFRKRSCLNWNIVVDEYDNGRFDKGISSNSIDIPPFG